MGAIYCIAVSRLLCAQFALSGCHLDGSRLGHVGSARRYTRGTSPARSEEEGECLGFFFVCIFDVVVLLTVFWVPNYLC